ncbi:MAG: radical SAM protein [Candidatus Wallbacteria bacterium]|nr:radical SAM protein [Candidatus Wallbacteria bacterium]
MKVILINPPSPSNGEHLHEYRQYPHLGLGYLCGALRSRKHDCKIIDSKFNGFSTAQAIQACRVEKPNLVGITSRTFDFSRGLVIAKALHEAGIPVIFGGSHANAMPRQLLSYYPFLDFVARGEAEETVSDTCDKLSSSEFCRIPNLFYREQGVVYHGPLVKACSDTDKLPLPDYSGYTGHFRKMFVMTSRGCPFSCIFCGSVLGRNLRRRTPENVASEIATLLRDYSFDYLEFADESFTLDREYTLQLLAAIRNQNLQHKLKWAASTRADLLDQELLSEMKVSGCWQLIIGAESGDPGILEEWKKGITRNQILSAAKMVKQAGISLDLNFILGAPNEDLYSILKTMTLIGKTNPEMASISIGTPYPGTVYNVLAAMNYGGLRLITRRFSDYNNQLGNALELDNLSRRTLELFQLSSYLYLYLRNHRFRDLLKFLFEFRKEGWYFLKKFLS